MTNKMNELSIVYQDDLLVVVDKPGGLLSVPGRGPDKQDCVVNRVKRLFPRSIDQPAVHRLDMDTSGLMLLALTADAHRNLARQFEDRQVEKVYVALLDGVIGGEAGEIRLPFRLDVDDRPHQIYDPVNGKLGVTFWKKMAVEGAMTRVEFTPLTGRTHQLRVHAAHPKGLNCSIVGDRLYGRGKLGEPLRLHASVLGFNHPESGERVVFESPLPF